MAVSRVQTSSVLQGFPKYRSMLAGNAGYDPAATWLIQRVAGTGSSNTITFSSIPSTYSSLQIRMISSNTNVGTGWSGLLVRFNSDSGTNYTRHALSGQGTAASAAGATAQTSAFIDNVVSRAGNTSTLASAVIDLHDYASSTKYKTLRGIGGIDLNGTGVINVVSNLWLNTAAITSISLVAEQDNWTASSTFALYGMK